MNKIGENHNLYTTLMTMIDLFEFPIKNSDDSFNDNFEGFEALLFKYKEGSERSIKQRCPKLKFVFNEQKKFGIAMINNETYILKISDLLKDNCINEVKGCIKKRKITQDKVPATFKKKEFSLINENCSQKHQSNIASSASNENLEKKHNISPPLLINKSCVDSHDPQINMNLFALNQNTEQKKNESDSLQKLQEVGEKEKQVLISNEEDKSIGE